MNKAEVETSGQEELDAKLKELNAKLDENTAAREAESKKLQAVVNKASEEAADIPTLVAERKAVSEVIRVLKEELAKIRDEWKERNNQWWDNERIFRAQVAIERKARQEAWEAEKKARRRGGALPRGCTWSHMTRSPVAVADGAHPLSSSAASRRRAQRGGRGDRDQPL